MTRALVLGGGGVAGIAWATGIAAGLARSGADIGAGRRHRRHVGRLGRRRAACLRRRYRDHAGAAAGAAGRTRASSCGRTRSGRRTRSNRQLMDKVGGYLRAARKRIGAHALRSETPPLAERRAIVAARLPQSDWPARALRVVAVDTATGDHAVFDRGSGVDFIDAIAASCAVPGTWPAVPINGRAWMDGGIRSLSNADLAAPAHCVLVIAPLGYAEGNPVSGHLRAEVRALEEGGARVAVIVPDARSIDAMTDNVLDPARCAPSAEAGIAQALRIAPEIVSFWNDGAAAC